MQPSLAWFRGKEFQLKAISEVITHYCSCANCTGEKMEAFEVLLYIAEQEFVLRQHYKHYYGTEMQPLLPCLDLSSSM